MTQQNLILDYMKIHKTITPYESFEKLGCTKLSTRIGELKRQGYIITSDWIEDVNRFGENVRYKRYTLNRSKDWSEDDLYDMSKERFTGLYDVSDEEYEMLQKEYQEM